MAKIANSPKEACLKYSFLLAKMALCLIANQSKRYFGDSHPFMERLIIIEMMKEVFD